LEVFELSLLAFGGGNFGRLVWYCCITRKSLCSIFGRGMDLAFSSGGGSRREGGWLLRGAQLLEGRFLVSFATSYRHVDLGTRYARVTQESRVCRVRKERVAMIVRGGQLLVSSH
jgi:hypothetical protein